MKSKASVSLLVLVALFGVVTQFSHPPADSAPQDSSYSDVDIVVETARAIHASWPTPLPSHNGLSLDWMTAETNRRLAEIAVAADIPSTQAPTVATTRDAVFRILMDELRAESPPDAVARALATMRDEAQAVGGSGHKPSPYMSLMALPYLYESGLCRGDVFSPEGVHCAYRFDSSGHNRVRAQQTDAATGLPITIETPDPASSFGDILQRSVQMPAATVDVVQHAAPAGGLLATVGRTLEVIPGAWAQDAAVDASEDAICFELPTVESFTFSVRLDPYEFGVLLYANTFGLFDYRNVLQRAYSDALGHFTDAYDERRRRAVQRRNDGENFSPGSRADGRCAGQGTREQTDDCFDRALEDLQRSEFLAFSVFNYITPSRKFKLKENGEVDTFVTDDGVERPKLREATDVNRRYAAGIALARTFLTRIVHLEAYGEFYILGNVQVGPAGVPGGQDDEHAAMQDDDEQPPITPESSQVFVNFPFNFECVAHKCRRMARCIAQGNFALACGERFAKREDRQIRPAGSYAVHGINTCTAQRMRLNESAGYNGITNADAVGVELPFNVRLQTRFQQRPADGAGFEEDNDTLICPAPNDTDPHSALESPPSVGDAEEPFEHLCPPPTEIRGYNTGPGQPDVYDYVTYASDVETNAAHTDQRPPEQRPYWIYKFDQVRTGEEDYNLIFAGLRSTHDAYEASLEAEDMARDAALAVSPVPVPYTRPACDPMRDLSDIVSPRARRIGEEDMPRRPDGSMDAFWYWHGAANERPTPNAVGGGLMGVLAFLDYKDITVLENPQNVLGIFAGGGQLPGVGPGSEEGGWARGIRVPYSPKDQYWPTPQVWGGIAAGLAGALGTDTKVGKSYDCKTNILNVFQTSCDANTTFISPDYSGVDAIGGTGPEDSPHLPLPKQQVASNFDKNSACMTVIFPRVYHNARGRHARPHSIAKIAWASAVGCGCPQRP